MNIEINATTTSQDFSCGPLAGLESENQKLSSIVIKLLNIHNNNKFKVFLIFSNAD